GLGPDVVLFQEIEADQTPESRVDDSAAWLARYAGVSVEELLAGPELAPELAGVPAEIWLLKAMADRGLTGYTVVVGDQPEARAEEAYNLAVKCVTFTRFPVEAVRLHPTLNARPILETNLN